DRRSSAFDGPIEGHGEVMSTHGTGKVEALPEGAAQAVEQPGLPALLDTLGDHLHAEGAGQVQDGAHEGRVLRPLAEGLDERAIDLEHLDRVMAQVAERG